MRPLLAVPAAIALAVCAGPAAAADDAWTALARQADVCTAAHGYDPRDPGAVGEAQIAEGERAWRDCMYARIESAIVPTAQAADAWRALIAADREMTAAIAAGTLTRAERAAQVQTLVAQIMLAEIAATARRVDDTEARLKIYDEIEQIRRSIPPARFF
jgi:hypothetical protein